MKVYLDNAATTPLSKEVFEAMAPVLQNNFGNPSSTHAFGREVRGLIENARRTVAKLLHTTPGEIIFTSGGTEADNMAINEAVHSLGVKHIISTAIEHHAVLHTAEKMHEQHNIELHFLDVDNCGKIDYNQLEELLSAHSNVLVSLMHANNEIGNLLDIEKIGALCKTHGALFHTDTVQTMGHYHFDLNELNIDFLTGAAHKFHGPKGVGFLYANKRLKINPLILGGSQERGLRAGTENIYGIVGLAKALEECYAHLEDHQRHILELKSYMIDKLKNSLPEVEFNGTCDDLDASLYTVLSVRLPETEKSVIFLFLLDIKGIAVSGGSACSSGSNIGSHVLSQLHKEASQRPSVRFSFSRYNTKQEIDYVVECLEGIYETVNH